jgi:hypothetical protein
MTMPVPGPTRGELEQLQVAAERGDAEQVFDVYESVNARLGIPDETNAGWAMRIIADGAHAELRRLAAKQACGESA